MPDEDECFQMTLSLNGGLTMTSQKFISSMVIGGIPQAVASQDETSLGLPFLGASLRHGFEGGCTQQARPQSS